ncbi:MAG: ADP-glyceromanno-heptose 6-epimerase [Rickettsiales bacterium]
MKTILVTGGGGFIGSNLVTELLQRGTHNIVVCDEFGSSEKWRNLNKHPIYEVVPPKNMFSWLDENHQNLEMIFHLGAQSSTVEPNIDLSLEHNFRLSLKLWRWCNAKNVRFVYASSSATYGDGSKGFDDGLDSKTLHQLAPLSGYGWSKHLFDVHVSLEVERGECSIPQWVGLKIFNTYGPNEYHKKDQQSVITKIAQHALQAGRVNLFRSYNDNYANGEQKRDVIYVKDVVRVMLWCLDHPDVSGLFNLGTGTASTFNDMANAIFTAMSRPPNIHYVDMPETLAPIYQYYTQAKMDKLVAAGYSAGFMTLEQGITDYVQNYLVKDDQYL